MLKKIQYIYLLKKIYKNGCLEGSGVPVIHSLIHVLSFPQFYKAQLHMNMEYVSVQSLC
jgi:hypothetical protein